MKLITLNCHSLEEPDYEEKLSLFCAAVCKERPHIIALQEVNQTASASCAGPLRLARSGYVSCTEGFSGRNAAVFVKADNHALRAAELLSHLGYPCSWTWVPAKIGYDRYDEGLALFSQYPLLDTYQFPITSIQDYGNWKTRKALGIRAVTPLGPQKFFSLHMGWWNDAEEPFAGQWKRLTSWLAEHDAETEGTAEPVWLMGDFNAPAHIAGEGYTLVCSGGWQDTYESAAHRDSGITVAHTIDGWRHGADVNGMRIDYIFTDSHAKVRTSQVIFNGVYCPVVSDHFGIMAEVADDA